MVAGLAVLIVVGIVLGILGLVIKGLIWLAVIGIILVGLGIIAAVVQALRRSPGPRV